MRTFIINLRENTQRREDMIAQCSALGIEHEIFPAIKGSQLTEEEKKKHSSPINLLNNPGEMGCALSHLFIYKKMIDENIAMALILEDDALLGEETPDVLAFLEKEKINQPTATLLTPVSTYIDNEKTDVDHSHAIYNALSATRTHGYVINNKGAHALYNFLYPVWSVADHWFIFKEYDIINLRGLIPHCIHLSTFAESSDIGDERFTTENINKNRIKKRIIRSTFPIKLKIKRRINKLFYRYIKKSRIKSYSTE
ncbi:glycosyltransferase family 25 protein [Brenneria sp. g21c3]|uniref:glycosyltransferase family 25 protein n=1 Tax=Brenneria sp. g21c3 TaxID=3093893 RepID=UPI002EA20BDB|nr:glycosyltransferase family 25 protein [Brenneria sp. g21c3]